MVTGGYASSSALDSNEMFDRDALFNALGHHDWRPNFGVGAVPRFKRQLYKSSRASGQYLDLWGPALATNKHKTRLVYHLSDSNQVI